MLETFALNYMSYEFGYNCTDEIASIGIPECFNQSMYDTDSKMVGAEGDQKNPLLSHQLHN